MKVLIGAKCEPHGSDPVAGQRVRASDAFRGSGEGQVTSPHSLTGADGRLLVSAKQTGLHADRPLGFWNRQAKWLLQARVETSPQLLQAIVEFAGTYARHRFHARTAEKVALASHELLENAVTYGSVSADIVYTLGVVDDDIEVCVSNNASLARLQNLRAHLERLRVDPERVFREEMARSMSGTGARAALGLVRICHECQMDIGLDAEGSQVTLRARCLR